jgi:23S rRNA U2552 (ribose-2'-O)-methylase RlmE/FtsJ
MMPRISVLVVNLNNLEHTKNCINDLLQQDIPFNLTLINQNSSEAGTTEYFDDLFLKHSEGYFHGRIHILGVYNTGFNKPLNHIWNEFVENSETEFICFLNNDIRLSPNFLSSSINVLDTEPTVGIINHATNSKEFQTWSKNLNYVIQETPYRQGWDLIFRKDLYKKIPEELNFFYGDDYLFSKLYENGYVGAYVLNSPVIHYERSTTIEKNGMRDSSIDYEQFKNFDLKYKELHFNEKFSKWKPEFNELSFSPFCKYKNIYLGQTHETLSYFKEIISNFDTIIEIGFHRGGLSTWINDNKNSNSTLYCFDITEQFLESKDDINFIISNCFNPDTILQIKSFIELGNKTLLLCDGGNKELEFKIFSEFLKVGDVIMIHDYCESIDEYNLIANNNDWPSPPESFYNNINSDILKNNLKPFNYDNFKQVFWGSFIKESDLSIQLSILICSLLERNNTFLNKLLDNINQQIVNKPVEVLILSDNANRPVGTKRNDLLKLAKGKYVSFVDDDDRISNDYVDSILKEIYEWESDVIVFDAEITFDGYNPKLVKYGREYDYCEKPEAYYRHPNHLMVHKKENITEYFKDIKTGEDDEWALRMLPRIVTQSRINKILYYYDFNTSTKKYFE